MSHPLGTEDKKEGLPETGLKFLETMIKKVIKKLEKNSFEPKIQDASKAVLLKQKFSKTSQVEKTF
ncbi:MAG: hypothetical protein AMJ73_09450 [candidate division Zixibacteria bacterium SM1_73]|nr:MAG: hypothetical protein AMJ73_09450 [candidate division Zixibacteria bacterium SM1_73]